MSLALREAALALVRDDLPAGWDLLALRRRDPVSVSLDFGPAGGSPRARIVWAQPGKAAFRAFRAGPRYAAAYEDLPDACGPDLDHARALAGALAAPAEGPTLVAAPSAEGAAMPCAAAALREALPEGAHLADGWRALRYTEVAGRSPEVHLELAHEALPWRCRLVVRPASARPASAVGAAGLGISAPGRHGHHPPPGLRRHQAALAEALAQRLMHGAEGDFEARVLALAARDPWLLLHPHHLREALPHASWARWALLAAIDEGLPMSLFGAPRGAPLEPETHASLVRVLRGRFDVAPDLAQRTVALLARALGRPSAGSTSGERAPPPPLHPRVQGAAGAVGPTQLVDVAGGSYELGVDPPFVHPQSVLGEVYTRGPRRAELLPFSIGQAPVTQALWIEVLGRSAAPEATFAGPSHPVHHVSWVEAARFCNALSIREGLRPAYQIDGTSVAWPDRGALGYRLPTEDEWEAACLAGQAPQRPTSAEANFDGQPEGPWAAATTPVGSYPPNAWGLHDMQGNVWELVFDSVVGPGERAGRLHLACGGAWTSWSPRLVSAQARILYPPGGRGYDLGFRLARSR